MNSHERVNVKIQVTLWVPMLVANQRLFHLFIRFLVDREQLMLRIIRLGHLSDLCNLSNLDDMKEKISNCLGDMGDFSDFGRIR